MTSIGERTELEAEYRRAREDLPWAPDPGMTLDDRPDWRDRWDTEAEWRGER